jgi:site-specific recombinase XerD
MGKGKVGLPFREWPDADLCAWEALFAAGDPLEEAGAGRHWAAATRATNRNHYARWLAWLAAADALASSVQPWERATPERVRAFGEHLVAQVAPRTAASVLIGLKVVLKAMHPVSDWRWLMDLTNRLNSWAEPAVDRTAQTIPIERIHNACLRELDRLLTTPLTRRLDRVAYRDSLIVLMLSAAPVRLRNLAMIEIGMQLQIAEHGATLKFAGHETKNRQPLTHPLPRHLLPYLQCYLDRIRPSFRPAETCNALWLGFEGGPLTARSIYGRVILVTDRLLGVKINPHSFRACAATSLAERSSADARLAAPLLGHRYFSTTERHYIRAQQLESSRKVHATLADIRRSPRRGSP